MKNKALGLIETYGYIGAIEAADTAAKSAYVEIRAVEKVKGGLVTVHILGDVGAVKSAVDAVVQKCKALGICVSSHIIARPDVEVWNILPQKNTDEVREEMRDIEPKRMIDKSENKENIREDNIENDETTKIISNEEKIIENDKATDKAGQILSEEDKKDIENPQEEFKLPKHFYNMKVVLLRNYVRKLDGFPIPNKKIKFANKQQLIDALIEYYKNKPIKDE